LSTKTINSSEIIKGKTLFNKAKDKVFSNFKKALAHANEWMNDGELPSGGTFDDYVLHIREMMHLDTKRDKENDHPVVEIDGTASEEEDAKSNKDKKPSEEVPPHWIFEGYLASFATGPLSNDPSVLLNTKDPTDKSPQDSRKAFRKKQAEDKDSARSAIAASQVDGPLGKRGHSMHENQTVARVWQHDIQQQHRVLTDKIMAIQIQLTSLQADAKLAVESGRVLKLQEMN